MWTVVYVAKNREDAKRIIGAFESYGLLAKVHSLGEDDNENASLEILVPETEIDKAHTIIIDLDF